MSPLILNLEKRDTLTERERALVLEMSDRRVTIKAKHDIVEAGSKPLNSCWLLSGFAARYHILADGRRQISALHVAGDFVDLHSFLLEKMDHGVLALSDCTVALVSHQYLRDLSEDEPHLTRLLWLATLIDAATHRQWLTAAGRLPATAQLAHLLCEVYSRLKLVDLVEGSRFQFPISQAEIGDALGLSVVHTNRIIKELRNRGLVTWSGSTVDVQDWEALVSLAQFDGSYLNMVPKPR